MPSAGAQSKNPKRSTPARTGGRAAAKQKAPAGMLDDRAKREIVGVALALLGVALLIAVLSRTGAPVADVSSQGLKMAFGIGAYLIPVLLVVWGVSFFVRAEIHEVRTGIGLAIIAIAVISMAALASPDKDFFSQPQVLMTHGGYLGGSVAWALQSTVGTAIGFVVLIGTLLIGLIVIGLSITALVEWVRGAVNREPAEEAAPSRSRGRAARTVPLAGDEVVSESAVDAAASDL
jgi:DNA segregation ATPase FtsK/SpoIIIE, S-DNA-T family